MNYSEQKVLTSDNVKISFNFYDNGNESVVIVAPGWCMTKDSDAFKKISEAFAQKFDVLTMDFRGHGKSGGFFTFTSKELSDIDAVVNFAKENNYKNIYLVGFSLGAGLSLIYAAQNKSVGKVISVSPHSDFDKIENYMWKKEAWYETFKKFELMRFMSIRPSVVIRNKIKPVDVVENVKAPTLFIAGEKDPTVCEWHTKLLFDKAKCDKKYKFFQNGYHAEDLFLYFENEFMQTCFEWLDK